MVEGSWRRGPEPRLGLREFTAQSIAPDRPGRPDLKRSPCSCHCTACPSDLRNRVHWIPESLPTALPASQEIPCTPSR